MKRTILPQNFFERNTLAVAKSLLGKFLVRKYRGKETAYMITDIEAYHGFEDKGSHASHGKTVRNAPMFGAPGAWYVYFTYGMHWMLNIVTMKKEYPAAILIRGIREISGPAPLEKSRPKAAEAARSRRGRSLTGPARLTKKLHIDKKLNGLPANKKSGLWIEDRGIKISPSAVKRSPRIGIEYAGKVWSKKPWRFTVSNELAQSFTSKNQYVQKR